MLLIIEVALIILLSAILYMIYGIDRRSASGRMSRARVIECWNGEERRKHVRFNQDMSVVYVIQKKSHLRHNGRTVDISCGGMKLLMDDKLTKDVLINIFLTLPNSSGPVEIEGMVAWSEEAACTGNPSGKRYFHTGIKFTAIKEPDVSAFSNYIASLGASMAPA